MKQNLLNFSLFILAASAILSHCGSAAELDRAPLALANSLLATNQASIEDLVSEALEHNPELNFYKVEIAAAKAELRTAGTVANPEASTQVGAKRATDARTGLVGEGVAWSVSVLQTFEYPGRLGLRKAIANRQIELADLGYAQFRAGLKARVRSLAYAAHVAQQKESAASEVADRFQALMEVLVQREPAGVTPLLETRIIEANAVTAQRRASQARQGARMATLELNQLRGQPVEASIKIGPVHLVFRPPKGLDTLLAVARTNSFELSIRQAELAQQGFKVSLSRNERYPSVAVGPFYSEESVGEKNRTMGLGLSLALPLWNRHAGVIETAKARQQQAEVSVLLTERQIDRKVTENAFAYEVKLAEMSRWQPDAPEKLREAAEIGDRNYRLGAVPIAIYVELQKQYLEAVEALLDTKKEALDAAQELELLTGSRLYELEVISKNAHP